MNSTIRDVARAAGVGIATVSRVLHGHSTVSLELKQRVERAVAQLGYEPNAAAQTMRTKSSRLIACAVRDSAYSELAHFVRSAEAVIRDAGYTFLLTNTDEQVQREVGLVRLLARRHIDGLLIAKSADRDETLNEALASLGAPVVFIDRDVLPFADSVTIDHRRGVRAAVDYLVSLGHTRIGLVTGSSSMRPGRERIEAFTEALQAHRLPIDPGLIGSHSFFPDPAFDSVSGMLDRKSSPTAIISGGMALLSGVLRAVKLRGLVIGRDISIIAGCDSELAALMAPTITAIRWDVTAWGRMSAQLLLSRIQSADLAAGRQILLSTELIIRDSCGPPP